MTQAKSAPVAARNTVAVARRPATRHLGDSQSILVGLLSLVATAVAMYDLFLLAFLTR
jgi:hypothetical protein